MIPGLEALFQDYVDTPDWEKDLDNPARALSHQMLVSIAAIIGLREVLCDRINELLRNHDNLDAIAALQAQRTLVMVRWRNYREQLGFDDLKEPQTNLATGDVIESGQRAALRPLKLVDGASIDLPLPQDPTGTINLPSSLTLVDVQGGKILSQEREEALLSFDAAAANATGSGLEVLAGVLTSLPTLEAAMKPMGAGAGIHIGGPNLGGMVAASARGVAAIGSALSYLSSSAGKQAGFVWRERDFALQLNSAAAEALHIDQLIIGAQKAFATRTKEKTNNDEQAKRNAAVLSYLSSKFSSEALYLTLAGQLTQLQKQAWAAALDAVQAAQDVFHFDWLKPPPPLPSTLWSMAPNGLLSGEGLQLAVQQLETGYMSEAARRLEISRNFSLNQLNPFALMLLRETGQCEFMLDEALFDLDNPGHYARRLESVAISIPCVVGPTTPVSATLQLINSWVRTDPNATSYKRTDTYDNDQRFTNIDVDASVSAIVTSTGREDAGLFTPAQQDDRYGPFEGAGAISQWRLTLPSEYRQFPYRTISDVILLVRYRALRSDALVQPAQASVADALDALKPQGARLGVYLLTSAQHDFPDDWSRSNRAPDRKLTLTLTRDRLPYVFRKLAKIQAADSVAIWAPTDSDASLDNAKPMVITSKDADSWDIMVDSPTEPQDDCYLFFKYKLGTT